MSAKRTLVTLLSILPCIALGAFGPAVRVDPVL